MMNSNYIRKVGFIYTCTHVISLLRCFHDHHPSTPDDGVVVAVVVVVKFNIGYFLTYYYYDITN